jgi:hypothetical protein
MRYLMFEPKFAAAIRDQTKTQTIRARARVRPGDTLSLRRWAGTPYRSQQSTLANVTCLALTPIRIFLDDSGPPQINLGGHRLPDAWLLDFVRADGFPSVADFTCHWLALDHTTFTGTLIRWAYQDAPRVAESRVRRV